MSELDNTYRPFTPAPEYVAYNGLCDCRGPYDMHPFHAGSVTTSGSLVWTVEPGQGPWPPFLGVRVSPPDAYVGKHRKPEE